VFLPVVLFSTAIQSVSVTGTQWKVPLKTQVGQPYDIHTIDDDVRSLWSSGRFDDVRVDTKNGGIVFHVVENPRILLHEIRLEPHTFGLQVKIPEGTPLTKQRVHDIVKDVERQIRAKGYYAATVTYEMAPYRDGEVDLRLTIDAGQSLRVTSVVFEGETGLPDRDLRAALRSLRIHRIVGWRLLPSYTEDAVDADVARLRSLYMSKGYFDAKVRLNDTSFLGRDATISFVLDSGPRYRVNRWADASGMFQSSALCSCLFAARREAERAGILDFETRIDVRPLPGAALAADLDLHIDRGQPFRVRRISFSGNHHFGDAILRGNFRLDEGDLLDQRKLRESLDRLNRTRLFEPLNMESVAIRTDARTGAADIGVRVTEHKSGAWSLSGPVGPASFGGPLQASISSRLPAWGRGLFELSTYTVSLSLIAFAQPILPALGIATKTPLLPVMILRRPFLPALGWTSGFSVAPQLGWRVTAMGYGITQVQQRTLPDLGLELSSRSGRLQFQP